MTKRRKALLAFVTVLILVAVVFWVYISDFYHASDEAMQAFAGADYVNEKRISENVYAFVPEKPEVGFVFYPGGKVEASAYAPLMRACAQSNILCVLPEMPFNLAVLDMDAAQGIQNFFPEVEEWYIGGHSLGGAMAAYYAAENSADYSGLILLASYSGADISASGLDVLSIYGSEDGVLNKEKYEESLANLPEDYIELVIEGGNHARFAMYGEQQGDGEAFISAEEQISISAAAIRSFVN